MGRIDPVPSWMLCKRWRGAKITITWSFIWQDRGFMSELTMYINYKYDNKACILPLTLTLTFKALYGTRETPSLYSSMMVNILISLSQYHLWMIIYLLHRPLHSLFKKNYVFKTKKDSTPASNSKLPVARIVVVAVK